MPITLNHYLTNISKIKNDLSEDQRYKVVELMLDVMAADKVLDAKENELIENKLLNIILLNTLVIKLLKTNLKKQVKLTAFYPTNRKKKIMIILDMQHLKMVAVVKVVLEVLVEQIFQIFLKISLEILEVEEEVEEEVQIIEVLI